MRLLKGLVEGNVEDSETWLSAGSSVLLTD
jgi:hypothetical protein